MVMQINRYNLKQVKRIRYRAMGDPERVMDFTVSKKLEATDSSQFLAYLVPIVLHNSPLAKAQAFQEALVQMQKIDEIEIEIEFDDD